jgi:hypothetical protein
MFSIEYATEQLRSFWYTLDKYIADAELTLKIRDNRGYIIKDDDKPIGVMRYNLFWDLIPFLNLIYFEESFRGKGYGTKACTSSRSICESGMLIKWVSGYEKSKPCFIQYGQQVLEYW